MQEQEKEPDGLIAYDPATHYHLVPKWWAMYHEGVPPGIELLPNTGCIALFHGKPAAIAFIYTTNSKIVHVNYAMADPALGAGRRIKILRAAIKGAIAMAKEMTNNNCVIWACTDNAVVARIYGENKMICPGEADVYFLPVGNHNTEFLE